ncbi:hypothetical protein E2C01_000527 [Portunus trituberculatus]|uniref:Uncharacterized protein n=1 Tax=Portunus trituberculatus TaxID=210409 RepID=A0A5B7CFG9_PORTR|nr:hypothetical protein [Portunus trituberculatus]
MSVSLQPPAGWCLLGGSSDSGSPARRRRTPTTHRRGGRDSAQRGLPPASSLAPRWKTGTTTTTTSCSLPHHKLLTLAAAFLSSVTHKLMSAKVQCWLAIIYFFCMSVTLTCDVTRSEPLPLHRSKYEKLQNAHDEESEEESRDEVVMPRKDGRRMSPQPSPRSQDPAVPRHRRHHPMRMRRGKRQAGGQEAGGSKDSKPDGVFICVSDDDSIGSASDLKARINDEYDFEAGDRGDASETISSSVYHAECESVTTHEEDGRVGEGGDPSLIVRRGPKPSRAAIRARARALQEQESRRCTQDRLLGHEYGEKPLLQDDELDSGEEEAKFSDGGEASSGQQPSGLPVEQLSSRANVFPVPRPFRKISLDESSRPREQQLSEEDVFALAPFKSSLKKLNKKVFQSRSQPSSNTVSPLESSNQLIVTPPMANSSPAPVSLATLEAIESAPEPVRLPVQADIIYEESPSEEFPIYENVLLNANGASRAENGTTTPRFHYYENVPVPFTSMAATEASTAVTATLIKNPFVNPFLSESPASHAAGQDTSVHLSIASRPPQAATEQGLASKPCQLASQAVLSQSVDSLSPSSGVGPVASPSLHSTDLFGSMPFSNVTIAPPPSSDAKEFPALSQAALNGVSQFSPSSNSGSQAQYFPPPPEAQPHLTVLTSTPRTHKTQLPGPAPVAAPAPAITKESSLAELDDDADLFGAVPFKPIVQRSCHSGGPRSQTLPANMSSVFQAQMAQMARDDGHMDKLFGDFKVSKTKKSTPPSFRKPRTTHQKLSDSDTSTDDEAVMANRKPKHRDRSKDRLKYKNISEEFEEENMMVLPMKQFSHSKKEKITKKSKKHDKQEKKVEKPEKKPEKNVSFESAGISNMSFEDFTLEENRRELERSRLEAERGGDSLQSPEEDDSDLRTTGGTRFGSLKRGINPFSKLGR